MIIRSLRTKSIFRLPVGIFKHTKERHVHNTAHDHKTIEDKIDWAITYLQNNGGKDRAMDVTLPKIFFWVG
jgi:hypothetical protein